MPSRVFYLQPVLPPLQTAFLPAPAAAARCFLASSNRRCAWSFHAQTLR